MGDVLTTKTCCKHRGTVFDDVKRFLWQRSSEIIWLLCTYIDIKEFNKVPFLIMLYKKQFAPILTTLYVPWDHT